MVLAVVCLNRPICSYVYLSASKLAFGRRHPNLIYFFVNSLFKRHGHFSSHKLNEFLMPIYLVNISSCPFTSL